MQKKITIDRRKNTIVDRYGLDQNGKSILHVQAGRLGGSAKVQKGFAKSGKSQSAGSTGGKRSKIGYKFISEDDDAMYYIRKSDGVSVTFVK